jgi:toxin ParE1/3/4
VNNPGKLKPVRLHPEAQIELQESVEFYRERAGEQWATRFKGRIAESLAAIQANPERHPPAADFPETRKIRLHQFPFSLIYIDRPNYYWVVAVVHGSRRPGYWKSRITQ